MISLVGVGPGALNYMTREAILTIEKADRVWAFPRLKKTLDEIREDVEEVKGLDALIEKLQSGGDQVVAISGDPLFYGLAETLKRRGIAIDRIVPGLSSVQVAAAKLQLSWNDMAFFSFHGRAKDIAPLLAVKKACVLLDDRYSASDLSRDLWAAGARGVIHAMGDLSYEEESVESRAIGEAIPLDSKLTLAVIEIEMDA